MNHAANSHTCLERILTSGALSVLTPEDARLFTQRLHNHFETLFTRYVMVYGHQYDCYFHLQQLVKTLAQGFHQRKNRLRDQDVQSLEEPLWYRSEKETGMACYVDLIGPTITDLHQKIPYFKDLGITYLHLMPLYDSPDGDSDGGYAVSDYRKVNPQLGTMKQLEVLASALHKAGIRLVLDFVFNHTSDEHSWAQSALAGDPHYQSFYYMFDEHDEVQKYESTLREIFPQVRRGSFTYNDTVNKWVWTTFNSFQWDLNYSNPAVFNAITAEMLFLANIGCSALRLDALAFIWKEMGTDCENQPFAHILIQAFNACLQIVAPAVVFKSEAIVHPDEVVKYIDKQECQLSYNPLLMALLWDSLATRKTNLLTHSMKKSFTIANDTTWVNYIRCHDDIGWTFDDNIAHEIGVNPHDHRYFLNQFYTGRFEGSFASGVPFAENPSNGDCRVCGTLASLCGLENALASQDKQQMDTALARIRLLYGIVFSIGGIPLLYSSDELGLLNDHSYLDDASRRHDDRWVNRVAVTNRQIDLALGKRPPKNIIEHRQKEVYSSLKKMLKIRKSQPVFGDASTQILDTYNEHTFACLRVSNTGQQLMIIANFSEQPQSVNGDILTVVQRAAARDLLSDSQLTGNETEINVDGYQLQWWLVN
ncbi:amylosucrase [Alteromonas lipotrueiana]|uniref:amylosucrase n=1 Tax=Alteromonas lipotrueiana TaxID=2803815 RepID=UPI001C43D7EA|nr:amylosucrase [Alteromonas lipotrueiana]